MKNLIAIFLVAFSVSVNGQIYEDFTDNELENNPMWYGDLSNFDVLNGVLKSNSNTVNHTYSISTKNSLGLNTEWEFLVDLKFATSSANYVDVYLTSNDSNLHIGINGYFVRIGNTKDELFLIREDNGVITGIIDGQNNKTENTSIRIKVTRSQNGVWELLADYSGGKNFVSEGTATDLTHTSSDYFGILIKQSSTSFHKKHFFDEIYVGAIRKDTTPPSILSTVAVNNNSIKLLFSEELHNPTVSDFILSKGYGNPESIDINSSSITLNFSTDFIIGQYNLQLLGVTDYSKNTLDTTVTFKFEKIEYPLSNELLITEIFADPTPTVGLPEVEFIELYNNTNSALNLEGCSFSDASTSVSLDNYTLQAGTYLILCKIGNENQFSPFGDVFGVTGFPSLNNSEDNLLLLNANGDTLDGVNYTSSFYKDDIKKQGGYSLERIEFISKCNVENNWIASNASVGGTPGKENSINGQILDNEPPRVLRASILDDYNIELVLSEGLISADIITANFTLLESGENPIQLTKSSDVIMLQFGEILLANQFYTLFIDKLEDCYGNRCIDQSFSLIKPVEAKYNDIIFNELLFNPKTDGVDFIELYNTSENHIDLSSLNFVRINKGERADFSSLSTFTRLFKPKSYLVFTTDTTTIKQHYPNVVNSQLVELDKLPPMNNDAGTLLLLYKNGLQIDSVQYTEKQHFKLLSSYDGVSLEKISHREPSINTNNWHSASNISGFATPGFQNSQFIDNLTSSTAFQLKSKTFSPDGDGYNDVLLLQYNFSQEGFTANLYIYNLAGKLVAHPVNNKTLNTNGFLHWDGILENGSKAPLGNYILFLETFNLNGEVIKKKLPFNIAGRF